MVLVFGHGELPISLQQMDDYLKYREDTIGNVRPGTEKKIIWANEKNKQQTEYAVIYVHGFMATRQELSPVPEEIAQALNANIFFTRLKGHGRTADAYTNVTKDLWLRDLEEAYSIGLKIGKKVILIGCSTGASLSLLWAAKHPPNLAAVVLLSPNFGIQDTAAELLGLPGGKVLARLLIGKYYEDEDEKISPLEAYYWDQRCNSNGIVAMLRTAYAADDVELDKMSAPLLIVYSEHDETIEVEDILDFYEDNKDNANITLVNFKKAQHHVLGGKIISPETSNSLRDLIIDFFNKNKIVGTVSGTADSKNKN